MIQANVVQGFFGGGYVKLRHYIIHDNKIGVVVTFFIIILSLQVLIPPPQFHPLIFSICSVIPTMD